jgi:hypothetical protein
VGLTELPRHPVLREHDAIAECHRHDLIAVNRLRKGARRLKTGLAQYA